MNRGEIREEMREWVSLDAENMNPNRTLNTFIDRARARAVNKKAESDPYVNAGITLVTLSVDSLFTPLPTEITGDIFRVDDTTGTAASGGYIDDNGDLVTNSVQDADPSVTIGQPLTRVSPEDLGTGQRLGWVQVGRTISLAGINPIGRTLLVWYKREVKKFESDKDFCTIIPPAHHDAIMWGACFLAQGRLLGQPTPFIVQQDYEAMQRWLRYSPQPRLLQQRG